MYATDPPALLLILRGIYGANMGATSKFAR